MPGTNGPGRAAFEQIIRDLQTRVTALERQQQLVFTDASGAPIFVLGWLGAITGINAYGAASKKTGSWVQL